MIFELNTDLTEEKLKSFISERENDVKEAKNEALARLKKKENRLRKQEAESDEANVLSEAAVFLEGTPVDKLMSRALLDKKSLLHSYNNSESTAEQRAIFQFASNENVKPIVHLFRELYPNWKKAKKQLIPKMEQNNNNQMESKLSNGQELDDENTTKLKKKSKKSLKRKEEGKDVIDNDTENSGAPQKKKMKESFDTSSLSATEELDNSKTEGETVGAPKKKKKKKLNAIEKLLMSAAADPETSVASQESEVDDRSGDSEQENTSPKWQVNPEGNWQGGKFHKKRKGIKHGQFNGFSNDSKTWGEKVETPKKRKFNAIEKSSINAAADLNTSIVSQEESSEDREAGPVSEQENASPKWQANPKDRWQGGQFNRQSNGKYGQFNGFKRGQRNGYANQTSNHNSPRNKPVPKWKIMRFAPKDSANLINVTDEWKNKCASPKTDDEQKPSLLRPAWLTNPEEYKPEPMFRGQRNFQRRDPGNSNMIRVPSDWIDKRSPKKGDDAEAGSTGTSLLKPSWLTNPEEHKPSPSFNKFRGNGRRGRGNWRGKRN